MSTPEQQDSPITGNEAARGPAETPPLDLGPRLAWLRERKGWTVRDLSRGSGISGPAIVAYETEAATPSPELLLRLATTLATTTAWLTEGARGPAVDVSRPASELSDREIDAMLAAWMGYTFWAWVSGYPEMGPLTDVFPPGKAPEHPELYIGAVPLSQAPRMDRYEHGDDRIPFFASSHEGAAALRAHIRSLGWGTQHAFASTVLRLVEDAVVDEGCHSTFAVTDASPRTQADAAYMAFVYSPRETK